MKSKFFFLLAIAVGATGISQAQVPSVSVAPMTFTCPTSYQQLDDALFKDAVAGGEPQRWVQYFVSLGCPRNKESMKKLLVPLFGASAAGEGDAMRTLQVFGKFSGDQSQTVERAANGEQLRSRNGGAHLYNFRMISRVMAEGIPEILYKNVGMTPPGNADPTKNVALWIRYRCAVPGQAHSPPYGDPGPDENGTCASGVTPGVFDRVQMELMGPYKPFFQRECRKNNGLPCNSEGEYIWGIQVTISRTPAYASFLGLLTGGYVTP